MCETEEFNMFLANLEEFVFDEDKIVTIGWLSKTLDIHVNLAKKLLLTFTNDESFKSKLASSWFLMGTSRSNPASRKMLIVSSDQLESAREKFDKISSEHIYSIQKCGNNVLDMNIIYIADQSANKNIAQCTSLSNIKYDQIKIMENARSKIASAAAKPEHQSSTSEKKSVPKNSLEPFTKKKEVEKKSEASKKEDEKSNKGNSKESPSKQNGKVDKKVVSPTKKASPEKKTGKKKGAEKGAGCGNIASFFTRGVAPQVKKQEAKSSPAKPEANAKLDEKKDSKDNVEKKSKVDSKKQSKVDTKKESKVDTKKESRAKVDTKKESKVDTKKESKRSKEEDMEVDEPDENKEPEETVENVNKGGKQKDRKETKSKASKKSNKTMSKKKEKGTTKRRRIQVQSDSSDSEPEESMTERDRSLSPPPPSPPRLNIQSDDDDDSTTQTQGGGRKRKRKMVTKTMIDDSGFLRTVKEFETVSCSESDEDCTTQESKKVKVEEFKKQSPPVQKSPAKTKQTSILSFFKQSK